jgi:hypothetical protein
MLPPWERQTCESSSVVSVSVDIRLILCLGIRLGWFDGPMNVLDEFIRDILCR